MGKAGAQLLALVSYPLLARFYSPTQFGEFAMISSLVAVLSIASSGRYEAALVLSKKKHHTTRLFQLAQLLLIAYVLVLFIALLLPPVQTLLLRLNIDPLLLWIVPVLVFCGGYWQIVQNWLIRYQKFSKLSAVGFIQRSIVFLGALVALFFDWSINGLVVGLVAGFTFVFIIALVYQRHPLNVPAKTLTVIASRYRDFPLFSIPTLLLSLCAQHLPVLWLTFFYSQDAAGSFNLAYTLITVPIACLGLSFGDVYYQRLAQSDANDRIQLLLTFSRNYTIVLLPAALIAYFFGEQLTVAFLGDSWKASGEIVGMLAPLVLTTGLINLWMTSITVYRKQKFAVFINLIRLMLWTIALMGGLYVKNVFITYYLMSAFSILLFLGIGFLMFRISKKSNDSYSHSTLAYR